MHNKIANNTIALRNNRITINIIHNFECNCNFGFFKMITLREKNME